MRYFGIRKKSIYFIMLLFIFTARIRAIEVEIATGTNHDPPYVYGEYSIRIDNPGVTIDILHLIEKRSDIRFKIIKAPWKRVEYDVENGHIDAGFHFSYSEKRKAVLVYPILEGQLTPDPKYCISDRSYVMYRLKGKAISWDGRKIVLNSKNDNLIAVIRGSSILEKIKNMENNIYELDTDNQLIKMLLSHRIAAFVALENMLDPKIAGLNLEDREQIEKVLPAVEMKNYYIAFSKKFYENHTDVAWKIWKEIENIKKSGEMKKLLNKYVGVY